MTLHESAAADKLSDLAYRAIRDEILRGDLKFGEAVTRRRLAKRFGMSLPPVAEALQRLEQEGLVESRPRVGTRVRTPSELDVRGHFVVREALESQAARLFVDRSDAVARAELIGMAARLDAMFRDPAPDRVRYEELHEEFHLFIPRTVGYPTLTEAIGKQLRIWSWLGSRLYWGGPVTPLPGEEGPPWQSHERLAQALCCGEPVIADRTMRQHVRLGLDVILAHLPQLDVR